MKTPRKITRWKWMLVAAMTVLACGTLFGAMPDVEEIKLEGEYKYHLQDVWFDDSALYWAHTSQLLKTDLSGKIIAKADVSEHHAGIEVRDGKVYVAVCVLQGKTGGKTLSSSRVTVNVYDAKTLKLLEENVTDINDRSGSLAILDDGTFLVGCLRPPDIEKTQVRFHHLDKNYKLIKSYVLDNVPVKLGIETIKRRGDHYYFNQYASGGLCLKLDKNFREIARYKFDGTCGLVFDGDHAWIGSTHFNADKKRWASSLKRVTTPKGF